MKNTLLKIILGVVLGIFLALLFRCDPKCPEVETKVEYIEKRVEVPVEKIVYSDPTTDVVYIPKNHWDTIIIYRDKPIDIPVIATTEYIVPFSYETDSSSISGEANIIADSLYDFSFNVLDFSYDERVITKTVQAKRYMNLLLGTNLILNSSKDFMRGVNFNAAFKTRKDFIFEVGYNAMFDLPDNYSAGVKIPLFHKKK